MTTQDLLTLLIESIAVTFAVWMAIDFAVGLSQLGLVPDYPQQTGVSAIPAPELKLSLEAVPIIASAAPVLQIEQPKPELMQQRLKGVDLDRLPLRQARAIARELGIRQKVGGKDQTVDFLRAQIKTKLQQHQEIASAAIESGIVS